MILSVILFHWWGDHGCTKELFRWSDVCSRLTGENWVNCWKWGDQWDGIWQDRNDSNTGIVYIQHVSLSETVTENNFTASRGAILRFSPHTGDMRHTTPIVCRCGCGPKKRKIFYQISKYKRVAPVHHVHNFTKYLLLNHVIKLGEIQWMGTRSFYLRGSGYPQIFSAT